jgi:hypothetical protein
MKLSVLEIPVINTSRYPYLIRCGGVLALSHVEQSPKNVQDNVVNDVGSNLWLVQQSCGYPTQSINKKLQPRPV